MKLTKDSISCDILVYGGSFDPPHQGHIDCIHYALQRFPHSKIYVIPGNVIPTVGKKGLSTKKSKLNFEQRFAMLQEIIQNEFPGANIKLSDMERTMPQPNYSYLTLERIKQENPGMRIGFLMGSDQLESFLSWKQPETILSLANIIVIKRFSGDSKNNEQEASAAEKMHGSVNILQAGEKILKTLGIEYKWDEVNSCLLASESADHCGSIFLIDADTCQAESSKIKEKLKLMADIPSNWAPKYLMNSINSLYGKK